MNVFKLKKKIQTYLEDVEDKYEKFKLQKNQEMNEAIKTRRAEDPNITFDQAAIDVLLKRAVIAEAVVEIAKDLWYHLDLK